MIIGAALASLNAGQRGRPLPFGSPVRAKFTQYDDTMSASLMSAGDAEVSSGELLSGKTRTALRLLKTYGISAVCVAPELDASRLIEGLRRKHRVVVGGGQDRLKGLIFRVGHMGWVHDEDIDDLLEALRASLADARLKPAM